MAFPKNTFVPIIADVTEAAYFLWLNVYNNGEEFSVYFSKAGEGDEYVPKLDRELSAADDALTYAEFLADDDCTNVHVDSISEDMTIITGYINDLSGLVLDEVADLDSTEEHMNDKATFFTPTTT